MNIWMVDLDLSFSELGFLPTDSVSIQLPASSGNDSKSIEKTEMEAYQINFKINS